jgi:hypothetical protein
MPEVENQAGASPLEQVRHRRAGLRRTMTEVEVATAAALDGRAEPWRVRVLTCLDDLREAWVAHVNGTEGPGGLWEQIREDAPRLDGKLRGLRREHEALSGEIDGLRKDLAEAADDESGLADLRERSSALLLHLARHRQRGADLIYEAYQRDVGGNE